MQHLATPQELLEATFSERCRRGWAAVAPELEPYVGAQRWPSGLPLPDDLRCHIGRRIRPPQWLADASFCLWMLALLTYFQFMCAVVATTPPPFEDHGSAIAMCGFSYDANFACLPCLALGMLAIAVLVLVFYGILRKNQAVPQHVNSLYVLYALERTDPTSPHELICHFTLSRARGFVPTKVNVSVFADGTYEIGELHTQQARTNSHSQWHSLQQQGGDEVAAGGQFAAGIGQTSSAEQRAPPDAGADVKAHLLPDSAV